MPSGKSAGMVRGRTVGRALDLGMAGVPARGVAGSVPVARSIVSGPVLSLGQSA